MNVGLKSERTSPSFFLASQLVGTTRRSHWLAVLSLSRNPAKDDLATGQTSPEKTSSPGCTNAGFPHPRRTGSAPSALMSSTGTMLQNVPTRGRSPRGRVSSRLSKTAMLGGRTCSSACKRFCCSTTKRLRLRAPGLSTWVGDTL